MQTDPNATVIYNNKNTHQTWFKVVFEIRNQYLSYNTSVMLIEKENAECLEGHFMNANLLSGAVCFLEQLSPECFLGWPCNVK